MRKLKGYELGKNLDIDDIAIIVGPDEGSHYKDTKNKLKGKSGKIVSVTNNSNFPYKIIFEGQSERHHLGFNDNELKKKIMAVDDNGNLY